jgi:hypothetical protein
MGVWQKFHQLLFCFDIVYSDEIFFYTNIHLTEKFNLIYLVGKIGEHEKFALCFCSTNIDGFYRDWEIEKFATKLFNFHFVSFELIVCSLTASILGHQG